MLRIENADVLLAGENVQATYLGACAERGMEIVVPKSRNHMESLVSFNGGVLNILGIYPDFAGAVGLNHFSGRCQGAPCDFWLSDTNNASCADGFEPNGTNDLQSALIRQAFTECGLGTWDDGFARVEIGGSVVCSTNDAGPVARTCQDAMQREIRVNTGGDGNEPALGVGIYTLDTDGQEGPLPPYQAWCERDWTLVLKTAVDSALSYHHPAWTGPDTLNAQSADLAPADARLPSFDQVPVRQAMLVMGDYFVVADIAGDAPAASMRAIMAGDFMPTEIGRGQWLAMVADRRGGLQAHCNLEGFNAGLPESVQVRLGILGNNEMDCLSSDSFIGIGHTGSGACDNRPIVSGNNAAPLCGGGEVSHALPGLLYVREAITD